MIPNGNHVIVTADACGDSPNARRRPGPSRSFPEIHAEGRSLCLCEGALHLINLIVRDLDGAANTWQRTALRQALDDVRADVASLPPLGPVPVRAPR